MIVVKVGGSLYDLPDFRERLTLFLASLNDEILIVPGGGAAADVIREWNLVHGLGEESSHWLAVRAMDLAGHFLRTLTDARVLDVEPFLRKHDKLPHSWNVTSDSIAALVAQVTKASCLILLKSASEGSDLLDEYFPSIELTCPLRIINLRAALQSPSVATGRR